VQPNATNSLPDVELPRPPGAAAAFTKAGFWFGAVLLTLVILPLPHKPLSVGSLDSSWASVLTQARRNGWQFGTDIVFTYGPLGWLVVPFFDPDTVWPRLLASLGIYFVVAVGICRLFWRSHLVWRFVVLVSFVVFASNINWRNEVHLGLDFAYQCGLLAWGLLCFREGSRGGLTASVVVSALAIFGALAKFTFLVAGGFTVGVVVCAVALRGNRKAALLSGGCFVIGLPVCWLLCGQHLPNLWPFLRNGLSISLGYSQSMALEGSQQLRFWVVLLTVISIPPAVLAALNFRGGALDHEGEGDAAEVVGRRPPADRAWMLRAVLLVWLAGLLFLNWKHGFTMEERCHVELLLSFLAMLTLSLTTLPFSWAPLQKWLSAVGVAFVLLSVFTLQTTFFDGTPGQTLGRPFQSLARNCRELCAFPTYLRERNEAQAIEREDGALPASRRTIGTGAVDVFGTKQVFARFNDLNYRPRPVFQSYAALNPSLMRLNEAFYLSDRAPEYVLFLLVPFNKFPPLEDSLVFRQLVFNFAPVAAEEPFILLKARSSGPVQMTLLREGHSRFGQVIDLKEFGEANLWVEIDLRPNWRGLIRQWFYKPPKVRLAVRREPLPAKPITFKAPPAMLRAGFLASPLLLDNAALADFYRRAAVTRPLAYTVEVNPGTERWWQEAFTFRVYRIENQVAAWSDQR
jgi:hypothetical protein